VSVRLSRRSGNVDGNLGEAHHQKSIQLPTLTTRVARTLGAKAVDVALGS